MTIKCITNGELILSLQAKHNLVPHFPYVSDYAHRINEKFKVKTKEFSIPCFPVWLHELSRQYIFHKSDLWLFIL